MFLIFMRAYLINRHYGLEGINVVIINFYPDF